MPLALETNTNSVGRGTQIRIVQSHVRLEVIMVVDENKRRIITAVEAGGPYESEIEMLRKALKKLQPQKGLPFVADKGYDALDYRKPFG